MSLELPPDIVVPVEGRQHSRWETLAVVLTALATLGLSLTGTKWYIQASLGAATLLIAAALWFSPLRIFVRGRRLRARRTRVARKFWREFLRLEERFSEFVNDRDSRNLRHIINDIGGCQDEALFKVCPPDYLNVFYPIVSGRHLHIKRVRETEFRAAETELISMVSAYNNDYVLRPLQRLKTSAQFTRLEPTVREYRGGTIEEFRERWVKLLDDLTEFVAARNSDLEYERYHEAIQAYFERPKKLAP